MSKNQKLQVIDLTSETFDFSAGEFTLSGFTANDGKQWFSAQIVCDNLDIVDVAYAVSRLPYDDKAITVTNRNGIPVRNLVVTEPGLYRLIFTSRKAIAVQFQNWVFAEVLPAIRAHGGYISPSASEQQLIDLHVRVNSLQKQLEATTQQLTAEEERAERHRAHAWRLQQEIWQADNEEETDKAYRKLYDRNQG
jgi:prophage antirepressor-like protein